MAHDPINPAHYGKIQGLELEPLIMEAPYFLGAAIKYVWRCKNKGGAEDIRKARRCLELHLDAAPAAARLTRSRRAVHPQNPAQPPRPASHHHHENA